MTEAFDYTTKISLWSINGLTVTIEVKLPGETGLTRIDLLKDNPQLSAQFNQSTADRNGAYTTPHLEKAQGDDYDRLMVSLEDAIQRAYWHVNQAKLANSDVAWMMRAIQAKLAPYFLHEVAV